MPFNNETQDNLLQQMACDVAGKTRVMKQQMSATALDAKDLQNISACSVLLQLGLVIVYKSSLFLEPGMDVKNQMFVNSKYMAKSSVLRPRVLVLRRYTTFFTKWMKYCCFGASRVKSGSCKQEAR